MELKAFENTPQLLATSPIKPFPTFWKSILLLLSMLPFGVVAALPLIPFLPLNSGIATSIIYMGSVGGATCLGFYLRKNWQIKIGNVSLAVLGLAFLTILSMEVILDPVMNLVPSSDTLKEMMRGMKNEPIIFFITVVFAAPILEEMLFRNIILDGYLKNYKSVTAILLSALLFGLIHGNLQQGIGAFVIGVLLGWIYWKTESIALCILLHFTNNLIAYISALKLPDQYLDQSLREVIGNDTSYALIYLISLVVAVTSLVLLKKKLSRPVVSSVIQ